MGAWGISGSLLGPAAPVVESVFGSVAGAVGQGAAQAVPGAGTNPGIQSALANMQSAFSGLFGRTQGYLPACPLQPPAFGTGAIPANIQRNPASYLQGLRAPLQELQGVLNQVSSPQVPAAGGGASAPATGLPSGDYSYLDNMEQQIETLLQSSNTSDQLNAQVLMNEFSQRVETITSLLARLNEVLSKIAQNIAQ